MKLQLASKKDYANWDFCGSSQYFQKNAILILKQTITTSFQQ